MPAAASGAALAAGDFAGARDVAAWKGRVRATWGGVRVDHVESGGVGDSPEVGDEVRVAAYVSLGQLSPSDVDVQVVHGRVDVDDQLVDTATGSLALEESYEEGRHLFSGTVALRRSGAFGYTVRVLPRHASQASATETALVTSAS